MFNINDRVQLVVSKGPFGPKAKGIVAEMLDDGNLIVLIDEDENGTTIPPFPLPPSPAPDFEGI